MEKITLYTINCPKCKVIELKLKKKNIEYDTVTDTDTVIEVGDRVGIHSAPILQVGDQYFDFSKANEYINTL